MLRDHSSACFWPFYTHPRYQQTSVFPYIHLKHDVSISSYPPTTHLINIGQVRKKSIKINFFCARKVFFLGYFFLIFCSRQHLATPTHPPLCWCNTVPVPRYTSSCSIVNVLGNMQVTSIEACYCSCIAAKVSIWPPPPTQLFADVILEWFLGTLVAVVLWMYLVHASRGSSINNISHWEGRRGKILVTVANG